MYPTAAAVGLQVSSGGVSTSSGNLQDIIQIPENIPKTAKAQAV